MLRDFGGASDEEDEVQVLPRDAASGDGLLRRPQEQHRGVVRQAVHGREQGEGRHRCQARFSLSVHTRHGWVVVLCVILCIFDTLFHKSITWIGLKTFRFLKS